MDAVVHIAGREVLGDVLAVTPAPMRHGIEFAHVLMIVRVR
jgi:hypothetical protein